MWGICHYDNYDILQHFLKRYLSSIERLFDQGRMKESTKDALINKHNKISEIIRKEKHKEWQKENHQPQTQVNITIKCDKCGCECQPTNN